jgi:hypothetical protein
MKIQATLKKKCSVFLLLSNEKQQEDYFASVFFRMRYRLRIEEDCAIFHRMAETL